MLESLGLSFSWIRSSSSDASLNSLGNSTRKGSRKKRPSQSQDEQYEMNGSALHTGESSENEDDSEEEAFYPGLVNISGTYCFLNSVLQAMASLSFFQPQLEAIHSKAVELDVPTPVVDALRDTLIDRPSIPTALNTPKSQRSSFRPIPIINALSQPVPGKRSKLFSSREHQDAQELFQLLSECVKGESLAVDKEGQRDRGLGGLFVNTAIAEIGTSVFEGLTANRRSCVECGYTEAVMHFSFDNWQLSLPRMTVACTLQDCLADYIRLELLTDCICRKCSMLATYRRVQQEADKLTEAVTSDASVSQSKKKRARDARRLEARVKAALDEGRIEDDIKGVKMEKVFSKASTKQAMIARPPKVLALHLNRSVIYGGYAGRNSCRVIFPEVLDLTPYTTSGQLSTVPSVPISVPPPTIPRSTTPTQSIYATPRVLYRLSAVVCHYGQHSFGHYVCFRRKPRKTPSGLSIVPTPQLACPIGCECEDCQKYGHVRENRPPHPGSGWLRISDATVEECGLDRVLAEGVGAFMLFYERVMPQRPSIYLAHSPRSSEETVRPDHVNGSTLSVSTLSTSLSTSLTGSMMSEDDPLRPRVVRRTAGRSRSTTVTSRSTSKVRSVPEENGNAESHMSASTSSGVHEKIGNGHALEPLPAEPKPPDNTTPSTGRNEVQNVLSEPVDFLTLEDTPSETLSSPQPILPPRTQSPNPPIIATQTRIMSPQPIRPHITAASLIPDRTPVGLRA